MRPDVTTKRTMRDTLSRLGLITHTPEQQEREPSPEPTALRQPAVRIDTTRPVPARNAILQMRRPERVDLSVIGLGFVAVAFIASLLFWITSTFPVAVKIAGIGLMFLIVGLLTLALAYWVHRGGAQRGA